MVDFFGILGMKIYGFGGGERFRRLFRFELETEEKDLGFRRV